MTGPAIEVRGSDHVIQNVSATETRLTMSYGDLHVGNGSVNIAAGDRSVDFFLSPNHFPLRIAGESINLWMLYGDKEEQMAVQRLDNSGGSVKEAKLDVYDMTDYQKTVAFLYLLGVVTNDAYN